MATVTLRGNPLRTSGELPAVGSAAPGFRLTGTDLQDVELASLRGRRLVLNIFPSVDTPTCAASVRQFNAKIADYDATCLCISRDLPFALKRFCGAEGLDHVVSLSELRALDFGEAWGLRLLDGPLAGLLARAVVVLDGDGVVRYRELVPEIGQEPDYAAALAALGALG
jgi:thiol peroxidase